MKLSSVGRTPADPRYLWNLLLLTLLPTVTVVSGGCYFPFLFPDQEPYEDLSTLAKSEDAAVRIYGGTFPLTELIAWHFWFVTKPADSHTFNRWEAWSEPGEPYGHLRLNLLGPTQWARLSSVSLPVFVFAELTGPQAEPVVDFIESQSPLYPCADQFELLPGPNSATYIKWVLQNTGWDVELPHTAIGLEVQELECP